MKHTLFSVSATVLIVGFLFTIGATTTEATSVVRTGESLVVGAEQVVEGDYYGLSESATVAGEVSGDVLFAGGGFTFTGNATEDVMVFAGSADIDGTITDDVRVLGGAVKVGGTIAGDLFIVGQSLEVLPTAVIEGDVIFFGTSLVVNGSVGQNVYGAAEVVRIDSVVGGDIDMRLSALTLGERAVVTGDVRYVSAQEIERAQSAQVGGDVVRNDPVISFDGTTARVLVVPFLVALFTVLVIYVVFPRFVKKIGTYGAVSTLRSFIVGFGIFFLVPIAMTILFVSTIGTVLAGMLLVGYLLLLILSAVLSGVTAAALLRTVVGTTGDITVLHIVLGVVVVYVSVYIPIVGVPFMMSIVLLTLGSISINIYRLLRS